MQSMRSLLTIGLVGVGAWVAFRASGAHDMGVPWDMAFKYPLEPLENLRQKIWDQTHPLPGAAPAFTQMQISRPLVLMSNLGPK